MTEVSESEGPPADPEARARVLVGQTLGGRYRIADVVGLGGMGAVYRAEHVQLGKSVAVKVLHAEMTTQREAVLRFEREAMVSAKIQHPNVVNATDSGRLSDGSLYLVLEYVSGRSLREVIDEEGRLAPARVCAIGAQIAMALGAAHRADIIHRDLKPANVMLVVEGEADEMVKVLDFGIAKVLGAAASTEPLTRSGTVFGTPEYMSPEQARGETVGLRADLYALGVILYELCAGHPPFSAKELVAILLKHVQEPPPPLPVDVPEALSRVVMALLDKLPERRPADADQVARALADAHRHSLPPASAPAVPAMTTTPAPPPVNAAPALLARLGASFRRRALAAVARLPRPLRSSFVLATSALTLSFVLALAAWPAPVAPPELVERAENGEAHALAALEAIEPDARSADVWQALVRGSSVADRAVTAARLAIDALAAEPELVERDGMASALRRAVDRPETRDRALELAGTSLGSAGADLLFDVWSSTGAKTPSTREARRWLDTDAVRAAASPALGVALELREARGCEAVRQVLPRVAELGDQRCVLPLERFSETRGCGTFRLDDCFACLRGDSALADALAAVSGRQAPAF